MTTRTPPSRCPVCETEIEAGTGVGHDSKPHPGDYTLCVQCGALNAFADDLTIRPLTNEERHRLNANGIMRQQVEHAQLRLRHAGAKRN